MRAGGLRPWSFARRPRALARVLDSERGRPARHECALEQRRERGPGRRYASDGQPAKHVRPERNESGSNARELEAGQFALRKTRERFMMGDIYMALQTVDTV